MRAVLVGGARSRVVHSCATVMAMTSIQTPRHVLSTRRLYVRPEYEPSWQEAVKHAKSSGMSLSEVVSVVLREKFGPSDAAVTDEA